MTNKKLQKQISKKLQQLETIVDEIKRPKLERDCEYQLPNCLKVTDLQYIKKFGGVIINKHWICANCLKIVEKYKDQIK